MFNETIAHHTALLHRPSGGQLPMDQVQPHLFLGTLEAAQQPDVLDRAGVTRILNVTAEHPPAKRYQANTLVVPVVDQPHARLRESFERTHAFIAAGVAAGTGTLVHCQLGVSRSATVVLAYLMTDRHWRLSEAWAYLRGKRPQIEPNPGFLSQLRAHEHWLFGNVTSVARLTFLDTQTIDPEIFDDDPAAALAALVDRCAPEQAVQGISAAVDACVTHLCLRSTPELLAALPRAAEQIWQVHGGGGAQSQQARAAFSEVWLRLSTRSHPPRVAIEAALDRLVVGEIWQDLLIDVPLAWGFVDDLRAALTAAPCVSNDT